MSYDAATLEQKVGAGEAGAGWGGAGRRAADAKQGRWTVAWPTVVLVLGPAALHWPNVPSCCSSVARLPFPPCWFRDQTWQVMEGSLDLTADVACRDMSAEALQRYKRELKARASMAVVQDYIKAFYLPWEELPTWCQVRAASVRPGCTHTCAKDGPWVMGRPPLAPPRCGLAERCARLALGAPGRTYQ